MHIALGSNRLCLAGYSVPVCVSVCDFGYVCMCLSVGDRDVVV